MSLTVNEDENYGKFFSPIRQLQLNSVNNMAWRVKPEEVLIEVGKLFGSKVGLQKLNYEVNGKI